MTTATTTGAVVQGIGREEWELLTPRFADHNYRQTWSYGVAHAQRQGASSEHVAIRLDGELIGLADVRVKRVPVIGGGIAYISGGPLTRLAEVCDVQRLQHCLRALHHEYVARRGLVLRVLAPLAEASWNAAAGDVFESLEFSASDRAAQYRTLVVPLSRSLPEIRAALAQKWRNGLNQAERNALHIRHGNDDSILAEFRSIFDRFRSRKRFDVKLGADFYAHVQAHASESEKLTVVLAEECNEVVAGIVISMLGDTGVYLLGATEEAAMKNKAAYLLQWWAIQETRARGMRWYDLGGIDPVGNPGVFHFKAGMGGEPVTAAGPVESGSPYRVVAGRAVIGMYHWLERIAPRGATHR